MQPIEHRYENGIDEHGVIRNVAVLLVLLVSITHAESICRIAHMTWVVTALFIAGGVVIVAYMIGRGTNNPKLLYWSKSEVGTIVTTVILVGVILGGFFVLCRPDILPVAGEGFYDAVHRYLDGLRTDAMETAETLVLQGFNDQFEATAYWFVGYPILGGAGASHTAYRLALNAERQSLFNYVMIALTSLNIQLLLMDFLVKVTLEYLLPIGIIVRLIPRAKDAGNFLIAFALGVVLVYPSAYYLFMKVDERMAGGDGFPIPPNVSNGFIKPINIPDDVGVAWVDPQPEIDKTAKYLYYGIFMPNFVIVLTSSFVVSLYSAMRGAM